MEGDNNPKYFPIFNKQAKKATENQSEPEKSHIPLLIGVTAEILYSKHEEEKKNTTQIKISSTKAPSKKIDYSENLEANERLKNALECYSSRKTVLLLPNGKKNNMRNASEFFDVPRSTLGDRNTGRYSTVTPPKVGRHPIFSDQDLADIVNHLLKMSDIGYGYTPLQTMNLIRYLGEKCKDKPNFSASRKFLANLTTKFPELSLRKASAYEYQRAKSLTAELVQKFFDTLKTTYDLTKELSGQDIEPRNVWSLDEVGFKVNDKQNVFVMARKGQKNAFTIKSDDSFHVSVILCTNATGYTLPPYFILKQPNKPIFTDNCRKSGFQSSPIFYTSSAFLNFEAFQDFTKFFVKEAKYNENTYSVLILDGHKAHTFNLKALEYLNQNRVFSVAIPSHTSHVFNIGDRCVFGIMKKNLREVCLQFMREKAGKISLDEFPLVFKEVWSKSLNQQGIIKAFGSAGIYPLDNDWLTHDRNKNLLKLGGFSSTCCSNDSKMQKYSSFMDKFSYRNHICKLKYLDLDTPADKINTLMDFDLTRDVREVLEAKEEQFKVKLEKNEQDLKNSKKRKRTTFEDISQPRILNTDERLEALKAHQSKNKKNSATKKPTKKSKSSKSNEDEKLNVETPIKNSNSKSKKKGKSGKSSEEDELEFEIENKTPRSKNSTKGKSKKSNKDDDFEVEYETKSSKSPSTKVLKKMKLNDYMNDDSQVDIKISGPRLRSQEQSSLSTFIDGFSSNPEISSTLETETSKQNIYEIHIPMQFESSNLTSKKDLTLRVISSYTKIILISEKEIRMEEGKSYAIKKGDRFGLENRSTSKPAKLIVNVSK